MLGHDKPFEKHYVAKSGAKFSIKCTPTGLFFITMNNGGVKPWFCDHKYTSWRKAEKVLSDHTPIVPKDD